MNALNIKRFEVGPGIKHAIIWLSIISSFGAGWYTRGEISQGELASADLHILKDDITTKAINRAEKTKKEEELRGKLEGRQYDKDCGDKPINSFYE